MKKSVLLCLMIIAINLVVFADDAQNPQGGVCIPGLGCFSGVEGYFTGIGTAWFNPGFLYTYHSMVEKNAVGFEYGERFQREKRWLYLHYRLGDNYFGVAANRDAYTGFIPIDTTYFHPRGQFVYTLIGHLKDSVRAPSYIADLLWAKGVWGGGLGINVHVGSKGVEDQYQNVFAYTLQSKENMISGGGKIGFDRKDLFTVLGFDYLGSDNSYTISDTLNQSGDISYDFTYWQLMGDFKYKWWTSNTTYWSVPHISFNYQSGREELVSSELGDYALNSENNKKSYSFSIGTSFDKISILQSFSVGIDVSLTRSTDDYTVDTMVVLNNGDSVIVSMPGKATVTDIAFPQVFVANKCRFWKWLSSSTSFSYSVTHSSTTIEHPQLNWINVNYPPEVTTIEQDKGGIISELTFDIGAEIDVTEDIIVEVKFTDKIFYNTPYIMSGAPTVDYITQISARYEF
ncbi:MAG: hypothetical protein ACP5FK_01715 [bacterium]